MNKGYHIWTLGCQMNVADSQRLASELEKMGFRAVINPDEADVLVVNTCVVRQGAEDKGNGRIFELRQVKQQHPEKIIGVMGCMVGVRDPLPLRRKFPYVDVFMAPSEPQPMVKFLQEKGYEYDAQFIEAEALKARYALQDEDSDSAPTLLLPTHERGSLIATHVPVVYGCSHACSFCIIPFRRGVERSRSVGEIVSEVRSLAQQGVKEITLLGQIVDRYGKDIDDGPDLADLLRIVHDAGVPEGLQRIRFLTSHPNWMSDKLIDTVAELPHVMPQLEIAVQSGDDEVLQRMKRGYTQAEFRALVGKIRDRIPDSAIHTDVIVGFCGETEAQFMNTYNMLTELKIDKVHLAKYSPRPQTVSARTMPDDVPEADKERRRLLVDDQQAVIQAEINAKRLGTIQPVLVEEKQGNKWRGRTPTNKIVFFDDESRDRRGEVVDVEITWTGPWSMQGRLPATTAPSTSHEIIQLLSE